VLTFGSGQIQAFVASDVVEVGYLSVLMPDGVLLMVNRALDIQGLMEGILGLGIPKKDQEPITGPWQSPTEGQQHRGMLGGMMHRLKHIFGFGHDNAMLPLLSPMQVTDKVFGADWFRTAKPDKMQVPSSVSFLQTAGVSQFSMCLNDGGGKGVLRFDPPLTNSGPRLAAVSDEHWSVMLHSISVVPSKNGSNSANATGSADPMTPGGAVPLDLCTERDAAYAGYQGIRCSAIPDSGTTLLMARTDHIASLLSSICDNWARCRNNHTALLEAADLAAQAAAKRYGFDPFELKGYDAGKDVVLKMLLADCSSWMTGPESLAELPAIEIHVGSKDGTKDILRLTPKEYIMETTVSTDHELPDALFLQGSAKNESKEEQGGDFNVCMPAFGSMDFHTEEAGDIWILGMPLFFAYDVGFYLKGGPPGVSFTRQEESPCGSCEQDTEVLLEEHTAAHRQSTRGLRHVTGIPRMPSFVNSSRTL
jgi:hypothetical protein